MDLLNDYNVIRSRMMAECVKNGYSLKWYDRHEATAAIILHSLGFADAADVYATAARHSTRREMPC